MLPEGQQLGGRRELLAHLRELAVLGVQRRVELVVALHDARVRAVGVDELGVRIGAERDGEVDADRKVVGEHAPGLQHLVKGRALVLGGEEEHHAARLEAPAVDDLAREDGLAAALVHVEQDEPVLGDDERAVGELGVDLCTTRRAVNFWRVW